MNSYCVINTVIVIYLHLHYFCPYQDWLIINMITIVTDDAKSV